MSKRVRIVDLNGAKPLTIEADELARGLRTIRRMEGVSTRQLARTIDLSRSALCESLEDGSFLDRAHERARQIAGACGWELFIQARPVKRSG